MEERNGEWEVLYRELEVGSRKLGGGSLLANDRGVGSKDLAVGECTVGGWGWRGWLLWGLAAGRCGGWVRGSTTWI